MKNFYRNFLKLCSMLVLQNVVTLSVNLADNIMLGAFSETALSGVTTVNQVQFVFQQLLMALGDGLVIFGSQYWGKKETQQVRKISVWAMRTGLFIALILFILASFFPRQLLGLFTTDQTIIEAGMSYLTIIRFTYFFFAITQILLATLRCVEIAGIAFALSVMTLVINCTINWILIYGHFGAPGMGAAGAEVGTLTAEAIAANSAASNLFLMVKSAAVGAASAASVTMGKTIGSGDLDLAKLYSRKLQKLFVVMGLTCGVLLFFIRIPVLSLYQLSPETRNMANTFLIILSVVMVGMSYQMPTNGGIIRGSGSIAYSMKVDLISTWVVVIPLSAFVAFVVKASPAVVVCCLNADQIFKCVPAFIKCNYGHWIKNMTN